MSEPRWQFIPADDDGNLDPDNAVEIDQNNDCSFNLPDGSSVHVIGSVEADGDVTYDHPEWEP